MYIAPNVTPLKLSASAVGRQNSSAVRQSDNGTSELIPQSQYRSQAWHNCACLEVEEREVAKVSAGFCSTPCGWEKTVWIVAMAIVVFVETAWWVPSNQVVLR